MSFIQLSPEKWNFNVFNAIKNWMVLTAGTPSNCNSMIVSWGALGIMWNKPTASVYVRESRYTLPFMQVFSKTYILGIKKFYRFYYSRI